MRRARCFFNVVKRPGALALNASIMNASLLAGAAALGLALGCAAGDAIHVADSTGGTGGSAASNAGAAGSAGQPEAPNAPTPIFDDEGPPPDSPEAERCQKVDFLYVVDNSPSMTDKQANLARSFPGFSRVVQESLGTSDHHVMVVDTDDTNVGDILGHVDDGCSGKLGAGMRMGSEGQDCGIEGNQRFLADGQPHLADTFACLAQVGTFGNADERPIDALLAATGATSNQLDDCNEGFLRDDAVLVVTLITDEEDGLSKGDPTSWKHALRAIKGGNEKAIVMLGLIGDNQVAGGLPGGPCDTLSGSSSPRLQRFVESFEYGSLGSVCAPDYSQFFADAVRPIETACETFTPILR
jgi:hypothetical protein